MAQDKILLFTKEHLRKAYHYKSDNNTNVSFDIYFATVAKKDNDRGQMYLFRFTSKLHNLKMVHLLVFAKSTPQAEYFLRKQYPDAILYNIKVKVDKDSINRINNLL